jgi:hypothetical protein
MANEDAIVRIGNVGTIVEVTMQELVGSTLGALNLSTTNSQQVEFKRPDGSQHIVTGAVKNSPGSDGIIRYTDTAGAVFNHNDAIKGAWEARGVVGYSNGNTFKGSWSGFLVGE